MVLGQWLFSDTLEFILILLFGGLVLQGEETRSLRHPLWPEGELEVLCHSLFHKNLTPVQREATTFGLFKGRNNLPLLAGVVYDRNLLRNISASWHSELKLGLDLLWDGCQLVLI
jgi:hypothetical protein